MKFAIVGAGAIGGYLGVRLARAGHGVTFIARGANLQAIAAQGMTLITEAGQEEHVDGPSHGIRACTLAQADPHDVVLLTMKSHQVEPVVQEIDRLCHAETVIVTMQNGVPWWYFHRIGGPLEGTRLRSIDPEGRLWDRLDPARTVGSVVYPAAELIRPGVVRLLEGNRFTLGEPSGEKTPRVLAIAQALMDAGFKAPVSTDIRSEIWLKLWGNLTFNPVSALTHATLEDICRFPATHALAVQLMTEAQQIGEKLGVRFKVSIEQRIAGAEKIGAHKTSMLQDIEQGKAIELAALVGAVIELGELTRTPTPILGSVHALASLLAATLERHGGRLRVEPVSAARP